jgi:hypothetical protein
MGCLLVVLGWAATTPAGPGDPATDFDLDRARGHVAAIAVEPRPIGSEALERARGYVLAELQHLGLETDVQDFQVQNIYGNGRFVDAANVIGWIAGADHTRAVLLVTHLDTVPQTPGANDDAAGAAVLLEAARVLVEGAPLRNDVVFLFTDAEEPFGRKGMRTFMSVPGMPERFGFAVNLEANGSAGASLLAEISGSQQWVMDGYSAAVDRPAAFSFLTELSAALGDLGTDFDVVAEAGIPGVNLGYLRGSTRYHTAGDDIARLSAASMLHHGSQVVALARRFGAADLSERPVEMDLTFFTVAGRIVRYPSSWAISLVLAAAALFSAAAVRQLRNGFAGLGRAAATSALTLLAATAAGAVVWLQSAAVRATQTVMEGYGYVALSLGAAAAAMVAVHRVRRRSLRHSQRLVWTGWWLILAAATSLLMPGAGYLFVWAVLAASGWLLVDVARSGVALVRFITVAAPALVLTVPAVDTLFMFAQPRPGNTDSQMLAAVVVPLLIASSTAGLLSQAWHRSDRPTG